MAGIGSGIEIVVEDQVLERKADEFTKAITAMDQAFEGIRSMVNETSGYWEGEAGDSCRSMFFEEQEEILRIIERLRDHPAHLLQIAGLVKSNEQRLTEASAGLPTAPLD